MNSILKFKVIKYKVIYLIKRIILDKNKNILDFSNLPIILEA